VQSAEFIRSAVRPQDFLRDGRPELAFVGRSNVGKSSLINRLLGRRSLARTSSTPGRTRTVNYFLVNRRLYVVDLPGYGYARAARREREHWAEIVEAYFAHPADRVIVQLIDARVGATSLDVQAARYLLELGTSLIVAVTKVDRVPRYKRSQCLARIVELLQVPPQTKVLAVSSKTGEGITELRRELSVGD
jgi:GTP-binding protein